MFFVYKECMFSEAQKAESPGYLGSMTSVHIYSSNYINYQRYASSMSLHEVYRLFISRKPSEVIAL